LLFFIIRVRGDLLDFLFFIFFLRVIKDIVFTLFDLKLDVEESLKMSEQVNALLRDSTELCLRDIIARTKCHQHEKRPLISCINYAAIKDFIKHSKRCSLPKVFRELKFSRVEDVVLRVNDTCCGLSLKADRVAWLVTALVFFVVICMNPDVWDVVVEDFTNFVDNS